MGVSNSMLGGASAQEASQASGGGGTSGLTTSYPFDISGTYTSSTDMVDIYVRDKVSGSLLYSVSVTAASLNQDDIDDTKPGYKEISTGAVIFYRAQVSATPYQLFFYYQNWETWDPDGSWTIGAIDLGDI